MAYLKTAIWVVLLPWSAAAHVAIPDGWLRAGRWAGAHVFAVTIAATLLCNGRLFSGWVWRCFDPDPLESPLLFMSLSAPGDRIALWSAQTFVAWLIFFAAIPALGIALSFVLPGHRAWQRCAAKWSCYAAAALVPTVVLWYGWHLLFPGVYRMPGPMTVYAISPTPDLSASAAGAAYGVYWAVGLCCIAYRRRWKSLAQRFCVTGGRQRHGVSCRLIRYALVAPGCLGMRAAPFAALYVLAWWALSHIAFPGGGLEALR